MVHDSRRSLLRSLLRTLRKYRESVLHHARGTVRFSCRVLHRFREYNCFVRASGLAYSSLLALVPLAALVLSIFTLFGSYESITQQVQNFLVHTLVPTKQDMIISALNEFTANSRTLGALGLFLFLFTSVFMLMNIENNFNQIWGCPSTRGIVGRFSSYTSILVAGSILIAASFSVTQAALSYFSISEISQLAALHRLLIKILPTLFIWLTFFLMITVVPSARVRFPSALLGSFVGALLWDLARFFFSLWVNTSVRISVIYGSLAMIPLFLIWLFIAWLIILLSLVIAYVHQYHKQRWTGTLLRQTDCRQDLLVGLEVFLAICRTHWQGEPPPSLEGLAERLSLPDSRVRLAIEKLQEPPLIHPTGISTIGYIPAQSLERLPVQKVLSAVLGKEPTPPPAQEANPAIRLSRDFTHRGLDYFDDTTMADILNQEDPG